MRTGPVCWEDLTWCEIEELAESQLNQVALLPIGATEQHGPHLPTGTDTIIATELSRAVSRRTGAVVLPALSIGCSYGHGTALPGTLSVTPERLADLVRDAVVWAGASGFRRVLAVNGHFGNQASLAVAGDHLRHQHSELRFGVLNWWTLTPEVTAETLADGEDIHANRAETALMMALAPAQVRLDQLPFADDPDRSDGLVFRYTAPNLSLNGVTGSPSLATPELGQRLLDMVVGTMSAAVVRGRTEEPPLAGRPERVRTI
ncbi:MAG TPA: creatininase family protein [Acidimicrobiales bacterium]